MCAPRLLLREWMVVEERPHLPGRVDAAAIRPEHPFHGYPPAAGPLMAFALNGIEHYVRIIGAVRVLPARDIRGGGFDRIRSTPISPGPLRQKVRNARKCAAGKPGP